MIYLTGTTNIFGSMTIGSGSSWTPGPEPTGSFNNHPTLGTNIGYYYKLDETSGTTVTDEVVGNTGTLMEGAMVSGGKINYGYQISNGTGDYGIDMGDTSKMEYNTSWSHNMWVNVSTIKGVAMIVTKMDGVANRGFFIYNDTSGKLNLQLSNGTPNRINQITTAAVLNTTGVWKMMTITYDGSNTSAGLKTYIDGSLVTVSTSSNTLGANTVDVTNSLYLGSFDTTLDYSFEGTMDEYGFWNKELTTTEITALYNSGTGLQY